MHMTFIFNKELSRENITNRKTPLKTCRPDNGWRNMLLGPYALKSKSTTHTSQILEDITESPFPTREHTSGLANPRWAPHTLTLGVVTTNKLLVHLQCTGRYRHMTPNKRLHALVNHITLIIEAKLCHAAKTRRCRRSRCTSHYHLLPPSNNISKKISPRG
jgi:hypothetical protein